MLASSASSFFTSSNRCVARYSSWHQVFSQAKGRRSQCSSQSRSGPLPMMKKG